MPPKTSSIYPSSINRALCSDGMRCIKPLAPSRNETNSSRVNGGADGAILGICAYGRPDQAGNRRFPRWPVSDGLQGGKPTAPARASAEWRCRTADRIDPARVSPSRHNPGEAHLRRILRSYVMYYNKIRTHGPWTKIRRSGGQFSGTESSLQIRSSADFVTTISKSRFFWYTQAPKLPSPVNVTDSLHGARSFFTPSLSR